MPRIPKPYAHKGWFRTNVSGIRGHKLCRVDEGMARARRLLTLYIASLEHDREAGNATKPVGAGIQPQKPDPGQGKLVGEVHDLFLDFKQTENDPATYRFYLSKLKPFLERFGHRPVASLTEEDGINFKKWVLHEREWVRGGRKAGVKKLKKVTGVGPKTCNHYMRAARTLLNWAASRNRRYIAENPWKDISYLPEKPRERLITPEEFGHLMEQAGDEDFRETLFFMRHTTARPGETRTVEWPMVDWDNHRINLDRRKVKTRRSRTLSLVGEVEEMLKRRLERVRQQGGDVGGRIFLNGWGQELHENGFSRRFRRLRGRCVALGLIQPVRAGEKLVLYNTRHTRAVEMIRDEGIDLYTASREMGHASITTTVKHYIHLTDKDVTEKVRSARQVKPGA